MPPHAVPAGPLAVRWFAFDVPPLRAGARGIARVTLENAGSATWRSQRDEGVQLAYHWLDSLGNPIVWDGRRTALPHPVPPGERLELPVRVTAPIPPGDYVLAFDLVHEHRFWFAEIGNAPLELTVYGQEATAEGPIRLGATWELPALAPEEQAEVASR